MSECSDPFDEIGFQRINDAVNDWTKDWLMRLNAGKCKVMHQGKNTVKISFELDDLNTRERRL